ncbi:uncharacterized protein LOC120796721 [Xiphias gladius]|uniref:uncharacterized protein LOC120796721 n=1 Tax=Xiphias gladius TaxID=8245 RepID=UPI001A97FBC9|nr:uncharacterized protein LOC120796721 [Xiphias gladius]
MTAVLDPLEPFSAELHVIRRLNSSLYRTGGRNGLEPGCENSPLARFHPPAECVTLAPSRSDVPLLDHCFGQLSAGAEVDLGVKGQQKFIIFHHVASALWTEWNRQQLRLRNDAKKPIAFCSRCPRSGQIPLYTGTIGSENMDNIDNMDEDFHPLSLRRSILPPYTATARRTTIPGYTGKAAYANSGADAAVSVPAISSPACSSG